MTSPRWLALPLLVLPVLASAETRVTNSLPFDVDVCFPGPAVTVDSRLGLMGVAISASPHVTECLLPPANHGAKAVTVTLAWKLDDKGLGVSVTSNEGLTPAGVACLEKLPSRVAVTLAAGAQAIEATTDHALRDGDLLVAGVNAPSDLNATIRAAQPGWCECYAGHATTVPPLLRAKITLAAGKTRPATVDIASAPGADKLAACLREKILALPIAAPASPVTYPRPMVHLHSGAPDAAGLPPELAFYQLERVHARRSGKLLVAVGAVGASEERFDAAGASLRKGKGGRVAAIERVREACRELVTAQDAAVAASEALVASSDALVELTEKLGATWAPVLPRAKETRASEAADLAKFRESREITARACR